MFSHTLEIVLITEVATDWENGFHECHLLSLPPPHHFTLFLCASLWKKSTHE